MGADFSMDVEIGDEKLIKEANVIEEIAYRDTWYKGSDSFLSMIYERLKLAHALLANDGVLYLHCDLRVSSFLKQYWTKFLG